MERTIVSQDMIDLYDEYAHRPLPRRLFMERLVALAGSAVAANAVLALLEPNNANAQTVAPDDARIRTEERVTLAEGVIGYVARPAQPARNGFVIVVHENRGLNAHIRDVTRRMAVGGFVAFAPDYLLPLGGTPADPDQAREMIGRLPGDQVVEITRKAVAAGRAHPEGSGKVGITGFCWGGGVVNRTLVDIPELSAGVAYYGVAADPAKAAFIQGALMVHLASVDERVNSTYPAYEAALKAANVRHVIHRYEGTQHAFNNDTSAERYNKAAAELAWERTLAFFREELKGPAKAG